MSLFQFHAKRPPSEPQNDRQGFYTVPPADSVGWYWTPRVASLNDYGLDLDASERYMRPKTGEDYWGRKPIKQLDADQSYRDMGIMSITFGTGTVFTTAFAFGKSPFGPLPVQYDQAPSPFNYSKSYTAAQLYMAPKGSF